jgi:hypothetical protein
MVDSAETLELGAITLDRINAKQAGPCDFCLDTDNTPDEQPMLMIEGPQTFITCCEYHEGYLIMVLVNNYVKRIKRRSKAGYTGMIPKEEGEKCV